MKTIICIISLVVFVNCTSSQVVNKDFASFYNKYQDAEGVKSFSLNCNLGNMLKEDKDGQNDDLMKKMTSMRFFIAEKDNGNYANKIKNYLPGSVYHDLMIVKEDGSTVVFKIKEIEDKEINEIVMTVSKPDSFVAISFSGHFTYEEAKRMSGSIESDNVGDF